MYNTYTTADTSATDGWTRIYDNPAAPPPPTNNDGIKTGPESQGNKGDIVPWVGIAGSPNQPFGYVGSQHLNWAVDLTGSRDSAVISTADAVARYGYTAEIDTGGGAWFDNGRDAAGNITEIPTGWKHQTDIGLIRTDSSANITLKLSTLGTLQDPTFSRFGITLFTGLNTSIANYSHHGAWNRCGDTVPPPGNVCTIPPNYALDNPFYPAGVGSGLTYLMHSDNVTSTNGLSFHAQPGQVYSVFLGGWGFANWNSGVDQYRLDISSVPEPGTFWLFGSVLAGMGLTRRHKQRGGTAT
jgi:hypothetical protein